MAGVIGGGQVKVLDLFSGIGGFSLAMHRAGFETVAFSEIEPFPSRVLAERFDAPNLGDITKIKAREVERRFGRVDVVCGGFPCQDLSVAGKRAGLAGARSGLFWQIVRLADELRPRFLLLENVPGLLSSNGGRDFGAVVWALATLGYGVSWRVLDAQYFGVPQRRRRVFVIGCLGGPCPPEILFEPEGLRGDFEAGGEEGARVAAPLTAGSGSGRNRAGRRREDDYNIVAALTADGVGTCGVDDNQGQAGHIVAAPLTTKPYADNEAQESRLVYACQGSNVGEFGTLKSGNGHVTGGVPFVTHALTGEGFDASEDGTGRGTPIVPFDTTQITSGENRSNPKAGDPSHPLAAAGHPPAIAYPVQDGRERSKAQNGAGIGGEDDPAYTVNSTGEGAIAFTERERDQGRTFEHSEELAYALTNPASGGRTHSRQLYDGAGVRRLTPLECERLQGFPDGWTGITGASDSARYRACGNAIAVPVVEWIAHRLKGCG